MQTRKFCLAISALALAGLAACGAASDESATAVTSATTSVSPSPTATPIADEDYDGAQRLVGGLTEAGIDCINWERTENPIGAEERGSCYVGEQEVVASIYSNHEDAAAEPSIHHELLAGVADVVMVVGGNWTLSCETQTLGAEIEEKFGGNLYFIPA